MHQGWGGRVEFRMKASYFWWPATYGRRTEDGAVRAHASSQGWDTWNVHRSIEAGGEADEAAAEAPDARDWFMMTKTVDTCS